MVKPGCFCLDKNQVLAYFGNTHINNQRQSIRLKNYDYSQSGLYFVTVCTQNRKCLFGNVVDGEMVLNEFGAIVDKKISELKKYKNVDIDICCVMPNHVHFIIQIVGAGPCACPLYDHTNPCACPLYDRTDISGSTWNISGSTQGSTPTVGEYVKRLKTLTTRIYIENVNNNNWPSFNKRLWQRNYYEHIIRNKSEYRKICNYIRNNPQTWKCDQNYPRLF